MRDKNIQLPVRVSKSLMDKLKEIARTRNITVTTVVIRALIKAIYEEYKYK